MKYQRIILFIALSLSLTFSSALASIDKGVKAYKKQDFARALKEFKADGGKEACFNLGIMYFKGEGVKVNRQEAIKWFRKAADLGHMNAQFITGTFYDKGEDIPLDRSEAVRWYRKAAEQGHKQAQFNLGLMYTNGEGVEKDKKEAIVWLKMAARQGHVNAQKLLRVMGEEIPPSASGSIQPQGDPAAQSPEKRH